jgi:hypothetical protein
MWSWHVELRTRLGNVRFDLPCSLLRRCYVVSKLVPLPFSWLQVDYVTIAGKFVQGVDPVKGQGTALARFAGAGYQQVCDVGGWGGGEGGGHLYCLGLTAAGTGAAVLPVMSASSWRVLQLASQSQK